jgi:hypothetical protein
LVGALQVDVRLEGSDSAESWYLEYQYLDLIIFMEHSVNVCIIVVHIY